MQIYGQPRSCLAGGAKGEFKKGIGMCDEDHPYSGAVCLPSELVQDHQRGCLIVDRRAGDLATITGGTTKSKLFPQGNGWHNAPWSVVRLFLTVGGVLSCSCTLILSNLRFFDRSLCAPPPRQRQEGHDKEQLSPLLH